MHLLIAIRDDRYHLLDRLRSTVSGILDNSLELAHLEESAVREAIAGPIEVYNRDHTDHAPIVVEDAFVDGLVGQLKEVEAGVGKGAVDAQARDIELPYLQLALTKIWEAAGDAGAKRLDAGILQRRSVRQIVRDHVDEVLGALAPEDQALCARMFDRVVTPSGAKIAMKAADLAVLAGAGREAARVQRILDDLSRPHSRIFTPVPDPEGAPAYEVFHDVLGRPVLDWKERYENELRVDEERRRAEEERQEAERRVEEQRLRAEEEKRRFRITAMLAAVMALLAVAAASFGWYAFAAKRAADEATAEALLRQTHFLTVASREELQQGRPVTAVLLALEALPDAPDDTETPYFVGAEQALWTAWRTNHELRYFADHEASVGSAAFSPDGARW